MLIPAYAVGRRELLLVSGLPELGITGASAAGYTIVCVIPQTAISSLGSQWRFGFRAGNDTGTINNVYFGQRASSGDAFDFSASPAPVEVLCGGQSGIQFTASGGLVYSDVVSFEPSGSASLVFAFNIGSDLTSSSYAQNLGAGFATYRRAAVQQAGTVNKASYTVWSTQMLLFVQEIYAA